MRLAARLMLALAALACGAATVYGYAFLGGRWPDGNIVMHLQLGNSAAPLIDGSTGWNQSFESALAAWNGVVSMVSFKVVRDSPSPIGRDNGINNVFFASSFFGAPFGPSVLARDGPCYDTHDYRAWVEERNDIEKQADVLLRAVEVIV